MFIIPNGISSMGKEFVRERAIDRIDKSYLLE